jgi:hypothetical protein
MLLTNRALQMVVALVVVCGVGLITLGLIALFDVVISGMVLAIGMILGGCAALLAAVALVFRGGGADDA